MTSIATVHVAAEKSTNERSIIAAPPAVDWARLRFRLLAFMAPGAAQERALKRFLRPPPPRAGFSRMPDFPSLSRDDLRVRLETAWGRVEESTDLAVTSWGSGPAVYLVHGWGGAASQWSSFVEPLTSAGFKAVAFDAPGHGQSPARRASIPHFSAALRAVVERVGPAHAIIGHSLGGVACSVAVGRGLATSRVVMLGSPANPTEYFGTFLKQIGLPAHLHRAIRTKFAVEYDIGWEELPVRAPAHAQDMRALVVHDRDDREVPYVSADRIVRAWPAATLMTTDGLGHRRILRDPSVIERVVAFVAGRA